LEQILRRAGHVDGPLDPSAASSAQPGHTRSHVALGRVSSDQTVDGTATGERPSDERGSEWPERATPSGLTKSDRDDRQSADRGHPTFGVADVDTLVPPPLRETVPLIVKSAVARCHHIYLESRLSIVGVRDTITR
jgi:hypothetical protein